jgi:hypothetical protein
MPDTVPYGRKTQRPSPVPEIHIVWMTAGLGCDGDTVSITAATQPSIEDVLLGAIPGLPKVHLHNPVLAVENGSDFMKFWYQAATDQDNGMDRSPRTKGPGGYRDRHLRDVWWHSRDVRQSNGMHGTR